MNYSDILVVSDIDGTLINDSLSPADSTVKAVNRFISRGGNFALATGRAPMSSDYVTPFFEKKCPCVVFNGGGIYDYKEQKMLWQITLARSAFEIAEYVYKNAPFASVEVHIGSKIYLARSSARGEVHISQAGTAINRCSFDEIPKDGWNKVLFASMPEQTDSLIKQLHGYENMGCQLVHTSPFYYEIIPMGVSKATAMFRLADILGIDRKNVFAIGDYYNDMEMIHEAPVSACIVNSPDELKKEADIICPPVDDGAAAYFINKIETDYLGQQSM